MLHPDGHVAILDEPAVAVLNFTVDASHEGALLINAEGTGVRVQLGELVGYQTKEANWRGEIRIRENWNDGNQYRLVVDVLPQNSITAPVAWRLETVDDLGKVRNTNDADIKGAWVATRSNLIVRKVRAPPLTKIQVTLEMPEMTLRTWRVIAPWGYMVDEQCGCTVEGEPRYADLDGSRRAFVLNVWTPRLLRQQPWILEGWNESKHYDWRIITYAENPGFELTAMPTWIYYPRKTAALVPFAIAFETDVSEPFDAIVVETRWNI